ncbi:MAG: helix-turn-helix domain-containing protein [Candidatus Micrarchaeota archaeon]
MWVAEFRVWHETSETMKLTAKYDVVVTSIYLNEYKKGGKTFVTKALAVYGPDWKEYIAELSRELKRYHIRKIEGNHIYFTLPAKAYAYHTLVLGEDVFFVKPFILKGGYEYWFVGSWDKKNLLRLKDKVGRKSEHAKIQLLKLKEQPVDFFIPDVLEKLPEKRRDVLKKAVELGYYSFPRGINLKQLAKRLQLSPATLREHMRLAENELIPMAVRQMHEVF